jgi:hypothetical protein
MSDADADNILERALALSERSTDQRYPPESAMHLATASKELMVAYSRLRDVRMGEEQIEKYNAQFQDTTEKGEPEFFLPGEDPLVNPNN